MKFICALLPAALAACGGKDDDPPASDPALNWPGTYNGNLRERLTCTLNGEPGSYISMAQTSVLVTAGPGRDELESLDNSGEAFRYDRSRKGDTHLPNVNSVDLSQLRDVVRFVSGGMMAFISRASLLAELAASDRLKTKPR
jgi:hypothetical protein